ncbi:hypothetical protein [Mycobacterium sp.]|uniref:hypothetical protein n=1 Tax=Mycobacterium sp. TaxID=1785 RepID=UPI0031D3D702
MPQPDVWSLEPKAPHPEDIRRLIVLRQAVHPATADTFNYIAKQHVSVKVTSGDRWGR